MATNLATSAPTVEQIRELHVVFGRSEYVNRIDWWPHYRIARRLRRLFPYNPGSKSRRRKRGGKRLL